MAKDDITVKRLKTAPKKKAAKKKSTKNEFLTVKTQEYGHNYLAGAYNGLVNDALRGMTMYGQPEPLDLEERVKFYKDKYEYSERKNRSLQEQVDLLKSIINNAMTRSCSGSC